MIETRRIAVGQRFGEEVGLLLVVAFQADAVARLDDGFKQLDDAVGRDSLAEAQAGRPFEAAGPALAQRVPLA